MISSSGPIGPGAAVVTARLPKRAVLESLGDGVVYLLLDLDAQLNARVARLRADGVTITVRNIHDEHARVGAELAARGVRVLGRVLRRIRSRTGRDPWAIAARRSWRTVEPPRPDGVALPPVAEVPAPRAREIVRPDGTVAMRERRDTKDRPFQRDYLDVDGRAYLTRWVTRRTGVAKGAIVLDGDRITRYASIRSWHERWLRGLLEGGTGPVVGLGEVGADAVSALRTDRPRALVLAADGAVPRSGESLPLVRLGSDRAADIRAAIEATGGRP